VTSEHDKICLSKDEKLTRLKVLAK